MLAIQNFRFLALTEPFPICCSEAVYMKTFIQAGIERFQPDLFAGSRHVKNAPGLAQNAAFPGFENFVHLEPDDTLESGKDTDQGFHEADLLKLKQCNKERHIQDKYQEKGSSADYPFNSFVGGKEDLEDVPCPGAVG